ncbi:Possible pseudogene of GDP-mannose 4, 6-dehydratase [Synechococcus sp. RCC307]|nr:Possible pseudogene of GDP-mannose 4, 6-dehydratase [Synechococcus sp. RCC307]
MLVCWYSLAKQTKSQLSYDLSAQAHVAVSFESAEYIANYDALGSLRILGSVRILCLTEKTRIFQASTS